MLISFITVLVFAILVLLYCISPFPIWGAYFTLWRYVLFKKNKDIPLRSRARQAKYLVSYFFRVPWFTVFWYLDEILYPGYRKIDLKPIFIIGLPRSGTTFLHRTLARDSHNFRAVRHVEWRYPSISFQKLIKKTFLCDWLLGRNYWPKNKSGSVAAKMHPNHLSDWEEDGIFFEECLLYHFFIFLRFPYPELLEYLVRFEKRTEEFKQKILDLQERVIKKVLYLNDCCDKIYLSKEVTSHSKIPYFIKRYPKARFIVSVRDSKQVMNSLVPLIIHSTGSKVDVDPRTINGWSEKIRNHMGTECQLLMEMVGEVIPEDKQYRVFFDSTIKSTKSSIEALYRALGLEIKPEYLQYLQVTEANQKSRQKGYENNGEYEGYADYDMFISSMLDECKN